jgi:hypothetical protein
LPERIGEQRADQGSCRGSGTTFPEEIGELAGQVWLPSVQTENSQQGSIDTPLFLGAEMTGQHSEPTHVDSTDLFHENFRPCAVNLDLWSKRC